VSVRLSARSGGHRTTGGRRRPRDGGDPSLPARRGRPLSGAAPPDREEPPDPGDRWGWGRRADGFLARAGRSSTTIGGQPVRHAARDVGGSTALRRAAARHIDARSPALIGLALDAADVAQLFTRTSACSSGPAPTGPGTTSGGCHTLHLRVRAGYATAAQSYRAEFTGEFRGIVLPVIVRLHLRARGSTCSGSTASGMRPPTRARKTSKQGEAAAVPRRARPGILTLAGREALGRPVFKFAHTKLEPTRLSTSRNPTVWEPWGRSVPLRTFTSTLGISGRRSRGITFVSVGATTPSAGRDVAVRRGPCGGELATLPPASVAAHARPAHRWEER